MIASAMAREDINPRLVRSQNYDRARYLPGQLAAARKKVKMLENEARRYGMLELIEG